MKARCIEKGWFSLGWPINLDHIPPVVGVSPSVWPPRLSGTAGVSYRLSLVFYFIRLLVAGLRQSIECALQYV